MDGVDRGGPLALWASDAAAPQPRRGQVPVAVHTAVRQRQPDVSHPPGRGVGGCCRRGERRGGHPLTFLLTLPPQDRGRTRVESVVAIETAVVDPEQQVRQDQRPAT